MNYKNIVGIILLLTTLNVMSQSGTYAVFEIPEELKKNANAVVRLSNLDIVIERKNKMTLTYTRVVTVLNERGNKFVEAYAGYDNQLKIRKIEAHVYDEYGEEIKKIKKRDFIDQSAVDGGTLYSDSRVLYMPYMPTTYPYTVFFTYEMETQNTAFIPSWRPITGYYVSTEKDSYTLKDLANLGIRYKTKNFEEYDIEVKNNDKSLAFNLSNIQAKKPEQLSPVLSKMTPHGMIAVNQFHYYGADGYASNWKEFGDWVFNALLKGRNTVSNATQDKITQLVKGIDNPLERAQKVYEYVQNNTRYISVQVGIGGVQPIPASEVDRLKYGDCKGLTNYTQALLTVANVPSYYSVVQAGDEIVDFDPEFATLEQGNHIILAIPNGDELTWIDCTTQVHPFGFIGDFTDNRNVLLVKEGGSEIVKTTFYPDNQNTQNTNAKIKLESNGNFSSDVEINTQGIQYDSRFRIESLSNKDLMSYYKNLWGSINDLNVSSYKFSNDKDLVKFTEELQVNAKGYATINNESIIFSPNVFNKNTFVPDRYRNRQFNMEIQRGYLDVDEFEIEIPENYVVEGLPEHVTINNKFGEYAIEFSVNESNIVYKRKLLIKKGEYSKEDYNLYRDFRRKVSKLDKSIIVLKSK
ncbi:DUF3857 domain-containing transglutaminase family protein [Flavobacteriaceae bacterium S0825]|uniref:DUF3857 domain-containing protein n=1 Tax=Gaetbulibacter sp. S0825 TaxID=2720084 RepID=UPI00143196E3|nr:DUF3857 domain-containing transglutaminase family protein [Gaetbulibacter sp. S0825]MCK0108627.1 DUF3857 domain-containing transglutaminase family protein [Flavobacteriaceae bacterium S0825]NIX64263.1 DUF3857 domain-containing transglutaminase family protein [Gaetbulibacter sp. S0825]